MKPVITEHATAQSISTCAVQGVKSVDDVNQLSLEVDLLSEEFFTQEPEHHREYIDRAEKVYRSLEALFELFCRSKKNSEG